MPPYAHRDRHSNTMSRVLRHDRLRQIVEAIVVPNITMREDEEFLFEDNPTEYIQRDMEVRLSVPLLWCACDSCCPGREPLYPFFPVLTSPSNANHLQGSDQDTRRRCACDLVRALCQQFDEAVTAICLEYIGNMVQLYQTNPANWKSKDAAIALMLAVTVRAESAAKGASMLNERVDVMTFFTTHVRCGRAQRHRPSRRSVT